MARPSNEERDLSAPPPRMTVAELLLAGSDLGHLLERLLRRRADLTLAQFNALRVLKSRQPDNAQASDLTQGLRVSSAHATTILQQLEGRNLIERAESVADRRRRPVRLTVMGEAALATALPVLVQLEERLIGTLGPAEASALWSELRAVRMALREALATDDLDCVGP